MHCASVNRKVFFLISVMFLAVSVALASDEGPSSEVSVTGIAQFMRPSPGMAYAVPTVQSSKPSYGGSIQYTHWFGNNGLSAIYSVVASDGNFYSVPASWAMAISRHEGTISYVRRLFPYSRMDPYIEIGAGGFVTHGGLGWKLDGVWIPQGHLGFDGQFEVRSGAGFDLWRTRHFGIRTGYVAHWSRQPNFGDPNYHASRTFITEPQIGLSWTF